jgi:sn-glycerol 3-phosphate transport system substrate-binding protein
VLDRHMRTLAAPARLVVACVVAVTTLGFVGLRAGGVEAKATGACPVSALAKAKKPVQITFWNAIFATESQAVLGRLTDRFNASQSDVRVKLVEQPSLAEALQKYTAGLTSGDQPDLVQLPETSVQTMVDSRSTVPIQACVDADHYSLSDYLPRAIDYYTTQGVLRAMPWTVGDPVLYYDKAAFERAGLDPNRPPRTLDEVREYSQKIVSSGAAPHGIALHIDGYYPEYWFAKSNRVYVNNHNGRAGHATRVSLDNATGLRVFRWWKDMVDSGLALNTGSVSGNFDHLLAVGNGNAAMAFEAAAALGPISAVLSSGQYQNTRLGVGPLPGIGPDGGLPVGDSALWIPNHSSKEKQAAAWQFVKFLDAPEQQAELHVGAGYVPIRKSAIDEPIVKDLWARSPEYRVAYDQLVQGPSNDATAGAVIGDYQGVRDAVRDAITAMVLQGTSPEKALQQAQRGADSAIKAYNGRVGS